MEACATGLGLDKASPAAARAPDDRRVTAPPVSIPKPRPAIPFDRSMWKVLCLPRAARATLKKRSGCGQGALRFFSR